jgi:hypothetical protein
VRLCLCLSVIVADTKSVKVSQSSSQSVSQSGESALPLHTHTRTHRSNAPPLPLAGLSSPNYSIAKATAAPPTYAAAGCLCRLSPSLSLFLPSAPRALRAIPLACFKRPPANVPLDPFPPLQSAFARFLHCDFKPTSSASNSPCVYSPIKTLLSLSVCSSGRLFPACSFLLPLPPPSLDLPPPSPILEYPGFYPSFLSLLPSFLCRPQLLPLLPCRPTIRILTFIAIFGLCLASRPSPCSAMVF